MADQTQTQQAATDTQTAETKATAKAEADQKVATDEHAQHHVKLALKSPQVLGGTAAGAAIGWFFGGPMGALIGGGIGLVAERYAIVDPVGKIMNMIKPGSAA